MNRKDRRKAIREKPRYLRESRDAQIARIQQNGITLKDLEENYYIGLEAGRKAAHTMIYAGICLALKRQFKFGTKRIFKALQAVDQYIVEYLTSHEIIQSVFEEAGIELNFNDPVSTVKERE